MKEKIILASKSPRRKELLADLYPEFEIASADVDESLPLGIDLSEGVRLLAERKGKPIADSHTDALVISSDTLVALDGIALGKPKNRDDAYSMLRALSGRWHSVHTGIAVHFRGKLFSATATSKVHFKELADEEIYSYIATGEPMDKAGAYGIQGKAGRFVIEYTGDFDTIVGLSQTLTSRLVSEALRTAEKD